MPEHHNKKRNTQDVPANFSETDNKRPSKWRKFIAGTALTVAGIVGVPAAVVGIDHIATPHSHTTPNHDDYSSRDVNEFTLPELAAEKPLSPEVRQNFETALEHDTCDTKVSVDEVVKTYQQLFGYEQPYELSLEQFSSMADHQNNLINQLRLGGGYAQLPDNYLELKNNVLTDAIPASIYKETLATYLQTNFGLNVQYAVTEKDPMHGSIAEIPEEKLYDSASGFRGVALDIIEDTLNISPELIRKSIDRIVIGNTTQPTQAGPSSGFYRKKTILIDVPFQNKNNPIEEVSTHEYAHGIDEAICGNLAKKYRDKAYQALNPPSFAYGHQAFDDIQLLSHTKDNLSTLEFTDPRNATMSIAFARPYSVIDSAEDVATIGEIIFAPEKMEWLFQVGKDTTILQEKMALIITRLSKEHPVAAKFAIAQLNAARLEAAINDK